MCVNQKLSAKHNRRRVQKNRSRRSEAIDKIKELKLTKRGPINVPLVIAAIEEDVIDALVPTRIMGSRLPRIIDVTTKVSPTEIMALLEHRRWEERQVREHWLAQHPFAGLTAA